MEQRLFDAMDKAALVMVQVLEDIELDAKGAYKVDLNTRMKVFEKAQDWLSRRQKLRPEQEGADDEGVSILRRMVQDPSAMVEQFIGNPVFIKALDNAGFVRTPPKKPGRPNAEERKVRERYKAAQPAFERAQSADDDSALRKALKKGPQDDDDGDD